MKKATMVAILVLLFALSASAQMKIELYGGGGVNLPMSPDEFKDYMKMGHNFCAGVGFKINPNITIGGTIAYNLIPPDFDKLIDEMGDMAQDSLGVDVSSLEIDGFEAKVIEFLGDVKFNFGSEESSMNLYALGCIGISRISINGGSVNGEEMPDSLLDQIGSETKLSYGFGAGVDFKVSPKMSVFFEARYMFITTSDEDIEDIQDAQDIETAVESEKIVHLPIRAGIKFYLGGDEY